MLVPIEIKWWNADEAESFREAVYGIWIESLGPIGDPVEWRETRWDRHRSREGYRLVTASVGHDVVGFAYGYTGERGQYWSDWVTGELGEFVEEWIGGHFEFTELGVLPAFRGRGVGAALHDVLLDGVPHRRAMLGTFAGPDAPARILYRRRGWDELGVIDGTYRVMGKVLAPNAEKPRLHVP